ncbi:MAG: 23S rRNA (adenine(2503)-C(2))-methyltransferase RlmN [Firmicutes bacterium]|nr:23S rRNA (adenine(2503)-C(2))-methyltransferase RlmN [Bacillota bacterium]
MVDTGKAGIDYQGAIAGLSLGELEELVQGLGHKAFRAKQIYHWIYQRQATGMEEMTNLPRALREQLSDFRFWPWKIVIRRGSVDGTVKLLLEAIDGSQVETVAIPEGNRTTVCVSTQVGCAMGCTFCATGQLGFARNLTSQEILGQVLLARAATGRQITNVVYMGMGEPLLNYDAVLGSIALLNDPQGLAIGMRHITISTCGIVPGIYRLAKERLQLVLAISLHSADQRRRQEMMPVAKAYPLPELIEACRCYVQETGRRITFEYTLIAGVNDSLESAAQLAQLISGLACHVNLIPINPVGGTGFSRSKEGSVVRFARYLEEEGVSVTIRKERGTDIEAACGQLRGSPRLN